MNHIFEIFIGSKDYKCQIRSRNKIEDEKEKLLLLKEKLLAKKLIT